MTTVSPPTRFVALDIHRKYLVIGAVDPQQQVVLTPRRFGFEAFSDWAKTHLGPSDAVVLEATSHGMRNEVVEEKWEKHRNMPPCGPASPAWHPDRLCHGPRLASRLVDHARIRLLIESSGPGTD
jgi:hypothetical protein